MDHLPQASESFMSFATYISIFSTSRAKGIKPIIFQEMYFDSFYIAFFKYNVIWQYYCKSESDYLSFEAKIYSSF